MAAHRKASIRLGRALWEPTISTSEAAAGPVCHVSDRLSAGEVREVGLTTVRPRGDADHWPGPRIVGEGGTCPKFCINCETVWRLTWL